MYAQLGEIVFQNLFSFTDYSKSGTAGYAEHKPLVGKPRLQPVGPSLNELALSVRLHVAFCKPERELATLKRYMNENEILKLKTGSNVEDGHYVITDLSETLEDADVNGSPFSYVVSLTLKEYIIEDKVEAQKTENRDKALAVGDKKPVAKKKKNPPTCPKDVSKLVTAIDNRSQAILKVVQQQGGANSIENRKTIMENIDGIKADCTTLINRVNDMSSCIANHAGIRDNSMLVSSSANTLKEHINGFLTFLVYNDAQMITYNVSKLKTAAHPIIQQAITGK